MVNPIMVWRFEDAPKGMQDLSTNGGDEDWLALVPPEMKDDYISWLNVPAFGCCDCQKYDMPDGGVVVIGCHA